MGCLGPFPALATGPSLFFPVRCAAGFHGLLENDYREISRRFLEDFHRSDVEIRKADPNRVQNGFDLFDKSSSERIGSIIYEIKADKTGGNTLVVNVVSVDDDSQGNGFSTLLVAHVLANAHVPVSSVKGHLMWTNRTVYQEQRQKGKSPREAVKQTPFYKSLRRLGFGKIQKWKSYDLVLGQGTT